MKPVKKVKIGRPKVKNRRVKANYSLLESTIQIVEDFTQENALNTSVLLEKLIVEHINKNL